MCSSLKPTDNLTWFPAESRAVLRAGCLLCLFCGFGYFFFPLLIASNLFIQECCGVSKAVPENWSASTSSFQASSWEGSSRQLSYPSVLLLQQQMLLSFLWVHREGCWPRQGKGSVGKRLCCFPGALRRLCGAEISSLSRRENLGAAALKEQDFLKGVKEFEEWVQELWEGELIPFANYWEKKEKGEKWNNMESIGNCSESRKYMEFWGHIFNCLLEA